MPLEHQFDRPFAPQHRVPAAVAAVSAALDDAAGLPTWPLSDDELLDGIADVERELARLAELQLRMIRDADGRNVAAAHGATGIAALLRCRLNLRPHEARARVDLAAALDGPFPAVGAALAEGAISVGQAQAIVKALKKLPKDTPAETVRAAEQLLVGHGADCFDAGELARLGAHLRHRLTPETDDPDAGPADPGPGDAGPGELYLTEGEDGMVEVRGRLDPAAGAALRAALDPLAAPTPSADGVHDLRLPAQRRAEALGELAHRVLDAGTLPAVGGVRPHLTVTASLETLLGLAGAPAAEAGWGGLPLPRAVLDRLTCDSEVLRVLLNSDGVPLDVGRAERLVTPGIRRALVARDRCCVFPGCDRPADWCVAHHVLPWGRDGETKLDNLFLICQKHHAVVHHGGWEVRFGADRLPEFVPPVWVDRLRRPRRNPHCRSTASLLGPFAGRAGPQSPHSHPAAHAA